MDICHISNNILTNEIVLYILYCFILCKLEGLFWYF